MLAAGDAAVLILFTYIGRATHVSSAVDLDLLISAFPFVTGEWDIQLSLYIAMRPTLRIAHDRLPRSTMARESQDTWQ